MNISIFLDFSNFSIFHKTIVFPSLGAHTLAIDHRLTCRYWIWVRIIFIKISILYKCCFCYKPSLFEVFGRIALFIMLVLIISFMVQSMGSWGSSYDVLVNSSDDILYVCTCENIYDHIDLFTNFKIGVKHQISCG